MIRDREVKCRILLLEVCPSGKAAVTRGQSSLLCTRSCSSERVGVARVKFDSLADELDEDEGIAKLVSGFQRIEWGIDIADDVLPVFSQFEEESYIPEELKRVIGCIHNHPECSVHVVFSISGWVAAFISARVHVVVCRVPGCLRHLKMILPVPTMY